MNSHPMARVGLGLLLSLYSGLVAAQTTSIAHVLHAFPHDSGAFTEGLIVRGETLFESTGKYGESTLRRVDLSSGAVTAEIRLPQRYFGEGLALADEQLYQLTWKSQTAFVYDPATLERVGRRRYHGQGWGLTWDGRHLIMSNGSAVLRILDARDFTVVGQIRVTEDGRPVGNLNELEYIDGEIWANVWFSDRILRIDPATGSVVGVIIARDLRQALPRGAGGVLNGIAFDPLSRRLFATGKYWPRLFELALPVASADRKKRYQLPAPQERNE